ncbi:MAG: hypothetical protein KF767_14470 [Bdellovibrionaceae bacterium]|nr:hypothetical protein [Pseudobdellovibrionaceae bacterium]
MKKLITLTLISLAAASAHAWPERKFECKNVADLPNNVYEFKKLNVDGVDMAYVTVTRYYKGPMENGVVTTRSSSVKGLATESANSEGSEILMLGSLRFEFTNDELFNCKAP